eukprot:210919-Prymnesium_polylepis.1
MEAQEPSLRRAPRRSQSQPFSGWRRAATSAREQMTVLRMAPRPRDSRRRRDQWPCRGSA